MNYSPELKDALLRRMLPPNNESITKISREEGIFRCRVKTSKKKFRSKIKAMKEWIKAHRTMPLERIFKTVNAKLRGALPVLWGDG